MKKNIPSQQGFSIVETLVAITILMISIVGPLTIANKGLLAATYASEQVVASYLAQDAVEYIQNIKSNNIRDTATPDWLEDYDLISTGRGLTGCTQTAVCTVDTINGNPYSLTLRGIQVTTSADITPCVSNSATALKKNALGYNHASGSDTQYCRYFYLVWNAARPDQAKIVVSVKWDNGGTASEVVYENEIFNVQP